MECTPRFTVGGMSKSQTASNRWTVAALASRVGVTGDTIRYYERAGLLPEPARTAGGYRIYLTDSIDRLHFIQGAQRLGLRLREIRDLLAIRDTGTCPCEPAEILLRRRIVEIDAEMSRLTRLRKDLDHMVKHLPGADCIDPAPGTWQRQGGESNE